MLLHRPQAVIGRIEIPRRSRLLLRPIQNSPSRLLISQSFLS